jgi:transmembrane sensor
MADPDRLLPMPNNDRAGDEARDWLVRLTSGAAAPADLERFRAWRAASAENDQAFEQERLSWQRTQYLEAEFAAPLPRAAPARSGWHMRGLALTAGALAACLAVALVFTDTRFTADHVTGIGEQATVTLPDGSLAYLNSDSAIALRYQPGLRQVSLLRGEAFFDVKSNPAATFRVTAASGTTDAIGTAFAVRRVDDEVTVTVIEGAVRVVGAANPVAPLDRGVRVGKDQQTRYGAGPDGGAQPAILPVDAAEATAWRSGSIVFDGKPFAVAVAELGRYLPERIVMLDRARHAQPVSGMFSVRQPQHAIEALAATQHLSVTRIPRVMIVIR